MLRRGAALGLGGICVAEEVGGSALAALDAVVIFEALATGCPSLASYVSIHNMVAGMIDRFGDDEQRHRYVPGLCSMEQLGSYCLTEPDAGSDAAALRTTAVRDGDGYVLNGVKQFISGAGTSDVYVVMARTGGAGPGGISAFVVEKGTAGLSFGPNEDKMGWNAQPTRQVLFDDVRVPACARLGAEGSGFKVAMSGLDGGRLNIGACSSAARDRARADPAPTCSSASAFGGPLADQQALRFRLADMATDLEAARAHDAAGRRRPRRRRARRHPLVRHGQAVRHRRRLRGRQPGAAAARRLRLPLRDRHREDRPRPAGPPDPGRNQRDHAAHRVPRPAGRSA